MGKTKGCRCRLLILEQLAGQLCKQVQQKQSAADKDISNRTTSGCQEGEEETEYPIRERVCV